MAFFSVNGYHKLKRIQSPNKKTKCWDRYKTPDSMIFGLLYLIAVILVLVFEVSKYGSVLTTKVDLIQDSAFQYDVNQGLPVMHGIWLDFKPLAEKARSFQ